MDYSKESIDRQSKIADMKAAGIICYANNYRGKQDIKDLIEHKTSLKEVDFLMEHGAI